MSLNLLDISVFFIAWLFQAFTGFGAGIFIVGVLSLVYNPKDVVVSSAVINLFGTLFMAFLLLRNVRPRIDILLLLIVGSVPGILFGSNLLLSLNRDALKLLIGLFILSLGIYDLLVQRGTLSKFSMKKSTFASLGVGFIGGFFAGLVGMGGPPPVVYLNQVLEDVDEFKSTLTLFFTSNILFRILFYGLQGGAEHFNMSMIYAGALSIPPGVYLGLLLSRRLSSVKLKRIISMSVVLLGFFLVIKP